MIIFQLIKILHQVRLKKKFLQKTKKNRKIFNKDLLYFQIQKYQSFIVDL